jgi:hypothetical protein
MTRAATRAAGVQHGAARLIARFGGVVTPVRAGHRDYWLLDAAVGRYLYAVRTTTHPLGALFSGADGPAWTKETVGMAAIYTAQACVLGVQVDGAGRLVAVGEADVDTYDRLVADAWASYVGPGRQSLVLAVSVSDLAAV